MFFKNSVFFVRSDANRKAKFFRFLPQALATETITINTNRVRARTIIILLNNIFGGLRNLSWKWFKYATTEIPTLWRSDAFTKAKWKSQNESRCLQWIRCYKSAKWHFVVRFAFGRPKVQILNFHRSMAQYVLAPQQSHSLSSHKRCVLAWTDEGQRVARKLAPKARRGAKKTVCFSSYHLYPWGFFSISESSSVLFRTL